MLSLRLFPSFEKPVDRQRYLNVQPQRRGYGGIAAVLAFAGLCGFLLALPDRSLSPQVPVRVAVTTSSAKPVEKVAAVTADESAKLTTLCNDKPTARRACADAKAAREARLAQAFARAEAANGAARPSSPAVARARKAAVAANSASAEATPAGGEQPGAAAPRKPKAPRADDAPVERLVHVYDHIAPDGSRVPVYRRGNGSYEFGAVADGQYRQSRRAELGQPRTPSVFGLQ